ncbi:MAG: hypothetical protein JW810_06090 [Sedimentisphaerales bacterium]|nr:hypothetical protein [Sedimentisphaerales bacterium]
MRPIIFRLGTLRHLAVLASLATLAGCSSSVRYSARQEAKYIKPAVAVMRFENRAVTRIRWDLADGLADQLSDRLLATHRYVVLDRQQLNQVLADTQRTQNGQRAGQGRPQSGLKYLIKGTITDFGHVKTPPGAKGLLNWNPLSHDNYATVAATLYVIDMETGRIIASRSVEARLADSEDQPGTTYDQMAFGSFTFYRTRLGQATDTMLAKAVRQIAEIIDEQPFQPKIASVVNRQVVINGGSNRRIKTGTEYIVRPPAQMVLDPDTGRYLGHIAGEQVGRVRISLVTEKYAVADIVAGSDFQPGQTLFPQDGQTAANPVVFSSY